MKEKIKKLIKKIIKIIFGTEGYLFAKLYCSIFITAVLFYLFSENVKEQGNIQANYIFSTISGLLFTWLLFRALICDSILKLVIEIGRFYLIVIIFVFSVDFCLNTYVHFRGVGLIIMSLLACAGIISCSFYVTAKFIDLFIFIKKKFDAIWQRHVNSDQPATPKFISVIKNITAFLLSIGGLSAAITAIIKPWMDLLK